MPGELPVRGGRPSATGRLAPADPLDVDQACGGDREGVRRAVGEAGDRRGCRPNKGEDPYEAMFADPALWI